MRQVGLFNVLDKIIDNEIVFNDFINFSDKIDSLIEQGYNENKAIEITCRNWDYSNVEEILESFITE